MKRTMLLLVVGLLGMWQNCLIASANNCTTITLSAQDDRRTISTTGYPTSYTNNQDDCWVVDVSAVSPVGTETYVIQMDITDTDMEKIGSSCYDYGEARDGDTSSDTRLAKWCDSAPYPVVSSGSKLYLRFFSSSSNSGGAVFRGFSARVMVAVRAGVGTLSSQYTPACTPFALAATNVTYTLTSPNYPAQYTNSMDSCWVLYVDDTIASKSQYIVRLQVLDSQLETSSTCHYDDVQARDGDSATAKFISMWCGATIPDVAISCGPYMYIRMRSDHFGTYRGFRAYVNVVHKDSYTCTLTAAASSAGLPSGTIIGIVMGAVVLIILIIVIACICKAAHKKAKGPKVRRVRAKKGRKNGDPDTEMVPAPYAKHPSYYNQNAPPPYPGDTHPAMPTGGYVAPAAAPHGATLTTGYTQPAAPGYFMTAHTTGMPDAY